MTRLWEYLREARRLQPQRLQAQIGTAFTLEAQGKLPAAIEILQRATALMPNNPALFTHLGAARHWYGDYDGAMAAFDAALAVDSDYAEGHVERARTLLTLGRLEEGFAEAEWRWRSPAIAARRPKFKTPEWNGTQPLQGKTVLVYGSPLYADTIQFASLFTGTCRHGCAGRGNGRSLAENPDSIGTRCAERSGADRRRAVARFQRFDAQPPASAGRQAARNAWQTALYLARCRHHAVLDEAPGCP